MRYDAFFETDKTLRAATKNGAPRQPAQGMPYFVGDVLHWRGRSSYWGNNDQTRFLRLLIEHAPNSVSYEDIYEEVLGITWDFEDDRRQRAAVRQLKRRVCERLIADGMGDLADAIRAGNLTYALIR
jgi:hypothetical protein